MSNFLTYSNRLRQNIPSLSPQQAEDYVNQAWRDIRDADDEWSFLHRTEYWLVPGIITCVGLTLTQNSDQVGLTPAAVVQLAGLNNPPLTVRQFRLNGGGGPVYGIASTDLQQVTDGVMSAGDPTLVCASGPFSADDVGKILVVNGAAEGGENLETIVVSFTSPTEVELSDNASTPVSGATVSWGTELTLDRLYREQSQFEDATCVVQRLYYQPLEDMARLDHITDNITGYEFAFEIGTPDELDRFDPLRAATGLPYALFFHNFDPTTGKAIYEMWPAPQVERAYTVMYWARGTDFEDDAASLPAQIPEELLMLRAQMLGYEWLMTATEDPRRVGAIGAMMQRVTTRYSSMGNARAPLGLLERARRKDHSVYRKAFIKRRRYGNGQYPITSSYLQQTDFGPSFGSLGLTY